MDEEYVEYSSIAPSRESFFIQRKFSVIELLSLLI